MWQNLLQLFGRLTKKSATNFRRYLRIESMHFGKKSFHAWHTTNNCLKKTLLPISLPFSIYFFIPFDSESNCVESFNSFGERVRMSQNLTLTMQKIYWHIALGLIWNPKNIYWSTISIKFYGFFLLFASIEYAIYKFRLFKKYFGNFKFLDILLLKLYGILNLQYGIHISVCVLENHPVSGVS